MEDLVPNVKLKTDVDPKEFLARIEIIAGEQGRYEIYRDNAPEVDGGWELLGLRVKGAATHKGLTGQLVATPIDNPHLLAKVLASRWNPDLGYQTYVAAIHEVFDPLVQEYNRRFRSRRRLAIPTKESLETTSPLKAVEEAFRKVGIREALTSEQRLLEVTHTIDPGFVNQRRVQTILGPEGRSLLDELIRKTPDLPNWERSVRVGHLHSDVMLAFCRTAGVRPLEEVIATRTGRLFCSTEQLAGFSGIYDPSIERGVNLWLSPSDHDARVEFHYSVRHITSDTMRAELHQGARLSIIGELHSFAGEVIICHPLIMGTPWMTPTDPKWRDEAMWWGFDFFENVIEDFEEFARLREYPKPTDWSQLASISEWAFKSCLADILGGIPAKDWGGETSDFFTPHLTLAGKRVRGAFLLKGPARFAPMTLDMLGKRSDQIVRLAQEPAEVLFIQHCHEITSPVRATLRAFAVQPSRPRRYCLIDGRDSLWILEAYGLLEKAIGMSNSDK